MSSYRLGLTTLVICSLCVSVIGCKKKKQPPKPPIIEEVADQAPDLATEPEKEPVLPVYNTIEPPDYAEQRAYEKALDKVKYDPDLHGGKGVPGYENKFDWDPTITATIERVDTTGKLWRAEDGPGENVLFDVDRATKHITWTDRAGTNLLIYGHKDYDGGGALMTAELAVREAGAWVVSRAFKEMVEVCKADITLTPQVDKAWTVKDLDGDGFAEVTMAWSAGCSDAPDKIKHKVIIASKGKKYALRGTLGGEYTPGAEMKDAPEGVLDHAKSVWEKTSKKP